MLRKVAIGIVVILGTCLALLAVAFAAAQTPPAKDKIADVVAIGILVAWAPQLSTDQLRKRVASAGGIWADANRFRFDGIEITVTTDLMRLTFDTEGGSLIRAELLNEKSDEGDGPYVLLNETPPHTYVAETSQRAGDEFFPGYAEMMTRIGRERGWPPMERQSFEALRTPRGALLVGSPEQVVEKILFEHELFRHDRFLAQMSVGTMPHAQVMRSIELFGTEVAPAVRKELTASAQNTTV